MPPRKPKKKSRRARGSGSIFFHAGRGVWIGRVVVGRKPDGKPRYTECSAPTQGEVVRLMAAARPPGPDVTVADWSARWLATLTNRAQSASSYAGRLAHVLPALGHLRVTAVTSADVEHLAAGLLRAGKAPATVAGVLKVMSVMFRAAVRARLIPTNPVADARKPRVGRGKREVIPPAKLLGVVAAHARYAAAGPLALQAAVGCRVGEALALDVPDFDPTAGTVSITKTVVKLTGRVGVPKSQNGVRTIRVPAVALPGLAAAVAGRTAGPLFRSSTGRRYGHSACDAAMRQLSRDLGLPPGNSHLLRHSVATCLVARGVPIADVAKYIGDSVETLIRTYVHAGTVDPADALDAMFGGGNEPTPE